MGLISEGDLNQKEDKRMHRRTKDNLPEAVVTFFKAFAANFSREGGGLATTLVLAPPPGWVIGAEAALLMGTGTPHQ